MIVMTTAGGLLHDAGEKQRSEGIDDAELMADVILRHALGMDDDRAHLFALLQAPAHLLPRSLLLCECDDRKGEALRADAAHAFPGVHVDVRMDLAGLDRVLRVDV